MKINDTTTNRDIDNEALGILTEDLKFPNEVANMVVSYLRAANLMAVGVGTTDSANV